jgi:hypothetical protein
VAVGSAATVGRKGVGRLRRVTSKNRETKRESGLSYTACNGFALGLELQHRSPNQGVADSRGLPP